jgi:hypothetical protein
MAAVPTLLARSLRAGPPLFPSRSR